MTWQRPHRGDRRLHVHPVDRGRHHRGGAAQAAPAVLGADAQGDYLNSDFEFALIDFDPGDRGHLRRRRRGVRGRRVSGCYRGRRGRRLRRTLHAAGADLEDLTAAKRAGDTVLARPGAHPGRSGAPGRVAGRDGGREGHGVRSGPHPGTPARSLGVAGPHITANPFLSDAATSHRGHVGRVSTSTEVQAAVNGVKGA
jgi:hypothetical protein